MDDLTGLQSGFFDQVAKDPAVLLWVQGHL
jgi:hypothetical protein